MPKRGLERVKRILVTTDLTKPSLQGVDFAFGLARTFDAEVDVLFVMEPIPYSLPAFYFALAPQVPDLEARQLEIAKREMAALERRLDRKGRPFRLRRVKGATDRTIVAQAKRLRADLLVMATHGYRGFTRAFTGSVTESVMRSSTVPVLTVHISEEARARPTGKIRRILVPVDFSKPSREAAEAAAGLARAVKAEIVLLTVHETTSYAIAGAEVFVMQDGRTLAEEQERLAGEQLEDMRATLEKQGGRVRSRQAVGRPSHEIVEAARTLSADLIVMATHGRSGLSRLFLGSVTERVIRTADRPVLALPPGSVPARRSPKRRTRKTR